MTTEMREVEVKRAKWGPFGIDMTFNFGHLVIVGSIIISLFISWRNDAIVEQQRIAAEAANDAAVQVQIRTLSAALTNEIEDLNRAFETELKALSASVDAQIEANVTGVETLQKQLTAFEENRKVLINKNDMRVEAQQAAIQDLGVWRGIKDAENLAIRDRLSEIFDQFRATNQKLDRLQESVNRGGGRLLPEPQFTAPGDKGSSLEHEAIREALRS